MRKTIPLTVLLFIIVAYSAVWFYYAHKFSEGLLAQINALNGNSETVKISTKQVNASNFPLVPHFTVVEPTLTIDQSSTGKSVTSVTKIDDILVIPNMFFTQFDNRVIGDIHYSYEDGTQKMDQVIHCDANPDVMAVYSMSLASLGNKTPGDIINYIKTLNYSDSGCQVTDTLNKRVVSRSEHARITMNVDKTGDNKKINFTTDIAGIERVETKDDTNKGFGKSNINSDVYVTIITQPVKDGHAVLDAMDFTIKKLNFTSERLVIDISGTMSTTPASLLPTGTLEVKIDQYHNLLNYVADLFHIPNTDNINSVLRKASTTDNGDNLDIMVKSDENGLTFGKVTLPEAISAIVGKQ